MLYHPKWYKVSFVGSVHEADISDNELASGGFDVQLFSASDDKSS
jgi:hypothetical protein